MRYDVTTVVTEIDGECVDLNDSLAYFFDEKGFYRF